MDTTDFSLKLRLNAQELRGTYVKAFEGISHDFTAHLVLLLEAPLDKTVKLIGQNATLILNIDLIERFFNGYITAIQYSPFVDQSGFYQLKLKLSSWTVLFKNTCEYQIFTDKNIPTILTELFQAYPGYYLDFSQLNHSYPKLAYCVQYQESRWQFIRRLLSLAKIQSYIEHAETKHTLVCFEQNLMPFEDVDPQSFWAWQTRYGPTLADTWHSARSTNLKLGLRQNFSYQNASYQVVGLKHHAQDLSHGSQAIQLHDQPQTYFNQLYLMASETTYRARSPRCKPMILGVQTAQVDPAAELGTSLNFAWSPVVSPYSVAVLQPLADSEQSISFSHPAGAEVLVGYEDADPEQPLVLAACYNARQTPPFSAGPDSWVSGIKDSNQDGNNELRFDDTPQQEQISLNAARDLKISIGGEQRLQITGHYQEAAQGSTQIEAKGYILEAPSLSLQAGNSLIKISPDEIIVQSEAIDLN